MPKTERDESLYVFNTEEQVEAYAKKHRLNLLVRHADHWEAKKRGGPTLKLAFYRAKQGDARLVAPSISGETTVDS